MNGHGGHNDNEPPGNIVRMPTLAERDKARREQEKAERANAPKEALINMPPVTKFLLLAIIGIHIVVTQFLSPEQAQWVVMSFGFIPAIFSSGDIGNGLPLVTPFTHMFLHGSWMHVAMNALMLAAFGSGIEKWLGSKRLVILFVASGLFGVTAHYLLNAESIFPMIGASGGISGLFAAAILMLNRGHREVGGRFGILPFALIWIGISIGFGMLGGPDGSAIAWAAHVGGFLGGFAVLKMMRV